MFKNHKNFVKMRNKINDQEQKHQKMFDTITKKLGDETFIAQASSATTTLGEEGENGVTGWTTTEGKKIYGGNDRVSKEPTPEECKSKCA
jgi:hypothetical protein